MISFCFFHQRPEVFQRRLQAVVEAFVLHDFAAVLRHRVSVLPQADERETKVRFTPLLHEVEAGQRTSEPECKAGAQERIHQGDPHQQPGNDDRLVVERHADEAGGLPEDMQKGKQRHHRRQQAQAQLERLDDKQVDVLGDPLIGVVDLGLGQLQLLVALAAQPLAEHVAGRPAPPADGQLLLEMERANGKGGHADLQQDELQATDQKTVVVQGLQGVIEMQVPEIGEDVDTDQAQGHQYGSQQQQQGRVLFLGSPEGLREAPEIAKCVHGILVSLVANDVEFAGAGG